MMLRRYEADAWTLAILVTDETTGQERDLVADGASAEAVARIGAAPAVALAITIQGARVLVDVPQDTLVPGTGVIEVRVAIGADVQTAAVKLRVLPSLSVGA